jgi:hypothetical protein
LRRRRLHAGDGRLRRLPRRLPLSRRPALRKSTVQGGPRSLRRRRLHAGDGRLRDLSGRLSMPGRAALPKSPMHRRPRALRRRHVHAGDGGLRNLSGRLPMPQRTALLEPPVRPGTVTRRPMFHRGSSHTELRPLGQRGRRSEVRLGSPHDATYRRTGSS